MQAVSWLMTDFDGSGAIELRPQAVATLYNPILSCSLTCDTRKDQMKARKLVRALLGVLVLTQSAPNFAQSLNGKNLYTQRCAICHGGDIKGTGPLAKKSTPPTPDLTTASFKKRLENYPGVIVSSVILRPNGDLIPRTLRENGVKIAPHQWTVQDFRDLNKYMSDVISKSR